MTIDALVAPLRADVTSGASVVTRRATEVVRRAVDEAFPADRDEFRTIMVRLVVEILDAQPAMAPLVTLGSRVLDAAAEGTGIEDARTRVREAARGFADALETSNRRVAERARAVLPPSGRILTLSASTTVRAAVEGVDGLEVVCLESRPMSEGRGLARHLADGGTSTLYAVDAAAWTLTLRSDVVLLGADSVGDRGVVNKIGSRAVAAAAGEAGVPLYVLADRSKLLPPGFPQPLDDDRPDDEVWSDPEGVRVWNRYFEAIPLREIAGVITEDGVLDPRAVDRERGGMFVPPELGKWADERPKSGEPNGGSRV